MMLSISRTIVLVIPTLICGDAFSFEFKARKLPVLDSIDRRPPEDPQWILRQKFENCIPKRFNFGETVYKIKSVLHTRSLYGYNNLYQVIPGGTHIHCSLKFVQVKAKKARTMPEVSEEAVADQSTSDVPKYFLALYGHGGALFNIVKEENTQDLVFHKLEATLDAATNHYIMITEPVYVFDSGLRWPGTNDFVELPWIVTTHFDFKSFSPILHVTPSNEKTSFECTLEPSVGAFHNELFKAFHLFQVYRSSSKDWEFRLRYEPTEDKRDEPRKLMVYYAWFDAITLYEMECNWTEKNLQYYQHILQPLGSDTLRIMFLGWIDMHNHLTTPCGLPRFFYQPRATIDPPSDVMLVEQECIDEKTRKYAVKHTYYNENIFKINGLHSLAPTRHYRCSDTGPFKLLPYIHFARETMTLVELGKMLGGLCELDSKYNVAIKEGTTDLKTSENDQHCSKKRCNGSYDTHGRFFRFTRRRKDQIEWYPTKPDGNQP